MNVTIYKVAFRVEKDSSLNMLWDGGQFVALADYEKLRALLFMARDSLTDGDYSIRWEAFKEIDKALGTAESESDG